ncbi:MAG: tryptophan--tRNA ligase [Candidatus Altiarchaeota archaeon]|nr:tryptophan--tRNA ligase [Candidatus Altiarchaeota archaeon]
MAKVDAYNVSGEVDYDKLIKEFGASLIDKKLAKKLDYPLVPELYFAHRDLDQIIKKKFAIITGRGPSMNMHMGHLILWKFMKHLQDKFNTHVFIPFSDDEKLLARGLSIEHVIRMDYENLLDIIALGYDPKKTEIMLDLVNMKQEVYNLAIQISSHMTANTVRSAMGFSPESNIGLQFYPAMQAAHILYPSMKLGVPTIVPIGVDQDVFVKLTRDVAKKVGLPKPGDIMSKFLPGLSGGKMSSSDPKTAIFTTDDYSTVKKKIMNAFTGGRDTVEEHRKHGCNTEVCVVCKYQTLLYQDFDIVKRCSEGEVLSGENKVNLLEKVWKELEAHQKAREKAKDKVGKFVPELEDYEPTAQ